MMQRRVVLLLFLLVAGQAWAAKRALLVGINDYTYAPAEADLRGCVNDVLMTKTLLIDKFGFPPENVKVLLDSEATAYNILRSVQEWLITPGAPEDIVYFHFSGHGSQVSDTNHDEEDRRDELICPADMQEGKMSSVITDDQLKVVLGKIPGRNLTVVLDACHSGTGTRDLSLSRPRFVVFDSSLSQTRGLSTASASKAKQKQAGSGGVEGATQSQVTISGCAPEQTSADAWIRDGFYAGALTYFLVDNMRKAPPEMNYRELMERVVRDIQAKSFSQVPQIEGDMNLPLLGGRDVEAVTTPPIVPEMLVPAVAPASTATPSVAPIAPASVAIAPEVPVVPVLAAIPPEAPAVSVAPGIVTPPPVAAIPFVLVDVAAGGRVRLKAGYDQQVSRGSVYAIYPPGETAFTSPGVAEVQVVAVGDTWADGRIIVDGPVHPGSRAKLLLSGIEVGRLRLLLEGEDPGTLGAVQGALAACDFVELVDQTHRFDYRLQIRRDTTTVSLALVRDGAAGQPVSGTDPSTAVAALRPQLENAYATKALSALDNPDPPFKVEVWVNQGQSADSLGQSPDEKLAQAQIGNLIRFNFRADQSCYLTLIDLDANGEINVLFPNQYQPDGRIQGGQVYRTGVRGELPFQLRAAGPVGRELVKVIASLEPLDIPSLKMGQAGPAGTRRIESGSEFVRQLIRDLTTAGTVAGDSVPVAPTDRWVTDYLIIENLPKP